MVRWCVSVSLQLSLLVFVCERMEADGIDHAWTLGDPVLASGPLGTFSELGVKDPSIVYYEGMWHLFFTARGRENSTTGYVSAKDLAELATAPRHELEMIKGKSRYGCAPQVLYFRPHRKWYLIFQNLDARYQPAYSTTTTISDPKSWANPISLIEKDTKAKWIDFWVICDRTRAYLFYTQSQQVVMVRTTSLEDFPGGWGESRIAFHGVTEATHVYKVVGQNEFHMVYERNRGKIRSYGLAKAADLGGPWEKVTDQFATGESLRYVGDHKPWTGMVSHGEALRTGYNELMEYDPSQCRWLIQGVLKTDLNREYSKLPWKLGIISRDDSRGK